MSNNIHKAIILVRKGVKLSQEYAEQTIQSCNKYNLPYEILDAVEFLPCDQAYESVGTFIRSNYNANRPGICCNHASHIKFWKRVIEINKPCVILEHDTLVLGHINTIEIPDRCIVSMGNRVKLPDEYKPVSPIKKLLKIKKAAGIHSYAITPLTAKYLVDQTLAGVQTDADLYLMKHAKAGLVCELPLYMCEPPQVVAWARTSTIKIQKDENKETNSDLFNYLESCTPSWYAGLQIEHDITYTKQNLNFDMEVSTKDLSLIIDLVRQADNKDDILDAFSIEQFLSKRWLLKELLIHLGPIHFEKLVVHGGWFGSLALLINNLFNNDWGKRIKFNQIHNVDINPVMKEKAEHLLSNYNNFTHIVQDSLDYKYTGKENVVICTSCEHISKDSVQKLIDNVPKNCLIILQSNNFFRIHDHINCVNNIDEFKQQVKNCKILRAGSLDVGPYTRFMIFCIKY